MTCFDVADKDIFKVGIEDAGGVVQHRTHAIDRIAAHRASEGRCNNNQRQGLVQIIPVILSRSYVIG